MSMSNTRARASLSCFSLLLVLSLGCTVTRVGCMEGRPNVLSVSLIQGSSATSDCSDAERYAQVTNERYELSEHGSTFLSHLADAAAVYGIFTGLFNLIEHVPGALEALLDRRHPVEPAPVP